MKLKHAHVVLALMWTVAIGAGRARADEPDAQPQEGIKGPETGSVQPEPTEPAAAQAGATPAAMAPEPEAAGDKPKDEASGAGEPKDDANGGDKPKEEAAKAEAKEEAPKLNVELHAGAYIFYYQPLLSGIKPNLELYFAHLNFDGSIGDFGLHVEGRIRDTKLYDYYPSNAWVEEAYASYTHKYVTAKVGKIYTRLGRLWDNSFYGNIHFYEGLKLDPDYGISGEGSIGEGTGIHFDYALQYFLVDGRTNGSLPARDIVSIPDARARNEVVARVEPAYYFKDDTSLALGVSGQFFQADLAAAGTKNVFRVSADLTFTLGPFSLWGEFMRQMGQSVIDYPIATIPATMTTMEIPGKASAQNNYLLAGAEIKFWRFQARYNFCLVDYHDLDVLEWMSVAGLGFDIHDNINLLAEHVYWRRTDPGLPATLLDHSIDVSMYAHF